MYSGDVKMELNKIQQAIYNEYRMVGKVWAECPRQAGKTELLLFIAEQELKCNKKIMFKSFNKINLVRILDLLKERLKKEYKKLSKLIVTDNKDADVVFFDEIYYDLAIPRKDQKVVCLRTPLHKTLRFNYNQLPEDMKKYALKLRKSITKEQFDINFGGK